MQSCAIDSRQRLFRCSHREKKIPNFVSETRGNRSREYFVSESRVHHRAVAVAQIRAIDSNFRGQQFESSHHSIII